VAGHACPPVAQLGLARERCHSNDLSGSSVLRRAAAHFRSPGGEGGGQRERKREALHALWTHATRAWLAERLSQRTIAASAHPRGRARGRARARARPSPMTVT